ncbi:peptide deformylase [bacterium]|nr:peptide deformylase [bacterium]
MAILDIVIHPDARLRKISAPITAITEELKKFLEDFTETMYERDGVGLAAPQVGVLKRVVVIDINAGDDSKERNPVIYINPEIVSADGYVEFEEGCLSVPKIYEKVIRRETVVVKAYDINMREFITEADGMLAIALQHEIDHLNGKLFIDYISKLKYQRITKKMEKYKKDLDSTENQ